MIVGLSGGAGAVTASLAGRPDKQIKSQETEESYVHQALVMRTLTGSYYVGSSRIAGGASAAGSPTPGPEANLLPLYITYTVKAGDTLSSIAAAYNMPADYLIWNNPSAVGNADEVVEGQQLLIPSTPGIIYTVRPGDTLTELASYFNIEVSAIINYTPNRLISEDVVAIGATLILPGAVPPPPPPPPPPVTSTPARAAPVAPARVFAGFSWPAFGPITAYFGDGRGHTGIDIGVGWGTAVGASAPGTVSFAGAKGDGYGYYVIVSHSGGFSTVYAHLSAIYVSIGESVGTGETLGASGCSGICTGPHLHFEIRIGGVAVDPMGYLP